MKARDLLNLLKDINPDSEVYVVTNLEFPVQKEIQKIIKREDVKAEFEESKYKRNSDLFIIADRVVTTVTNEIGKAC